MVKPKPKPKPKKKPHPGPHAGLGPDLQCGRCVEILAEKIYRRLMKPPVKCGYCKGEHIPLVVSDLYVDRSQILAAIREELER